MTAITMAVDKGAIRRLSVRRLCVRRLCFGAVMVDIGISLSAGTATPPSTVTGAVQDAGLLPGNFAEKPRGMPHIGYANSENRVKARRQKGRSTRNRP